MQTPRDRPFLSLILPVLNEAATLGAQLAALQGLRTRGAELLSSTAAAATARQSWRGRPQTGLLAAPRGRATQMNAGAKASRGEVLLFLHADTTLPPAADDLIRSAIVAGAAWGRFDVRIDGRQPPAARRRADDELALAAERHRHRRSGDLRSSRFVRAGRRLSRASRLMEDIALSKRLKRFAPPACLRPR
jgi:glycosyltransferase involved in cell wall biosynthesis